MSDKQRAQLAMMLRTGMMDQEDYNETIAAMDVRDAGRSPAKDPDKIVEGSSYIVEDTDSMSDEEHRKWFIAQGHNFSRRTGEQLPHPSTDNPFKDRNREQIKEIASSVLPVAAIDSRTDPYQRWLGYLDLNLMQNAGYTLSHAMIIIPSLEPRTLYDMGAAAEDSAQDIATMIEDKQ